MVIICIFSISPLYFTSIFHLKDYFATFTIFPIGQARTVLSIFDFAGNRLAHNYVRWRGADCAT